MHASTLASRTIDTPLGPVLATAHQPHGTRPSLRSLRFIDLDSVTDDLPDGSRDDFLDDVEDHLHAYFHHRDPTALDRLPIAPRGTPFQHRVWDELRRIPFGRTTSYGELARLLGTPGAARAVGLANARNPIAIVVPCHRVLDSRGRLHGYAYGLERKRRLLEFEGAHASLAFA